MEICIDFAQISDIPRIMELLKQVHAVHSDGRPDLFERGATKYNEEQLKEILTNPLLPVLAARVGGEMVGYAFCKLQTPSFSSLVRQRHSLYIDDLCVDENCRGGGVGRALYNAALEYARRHDCYNLTLNVWELNGGAKAFYAKMGLLPQRTTLEKIL